jgi:Tol biopolymer transport system component
VRDPAVSPDGRWIVYVVQDADTPYSQLYAQAGPTGQPHQLTRTPDQKRYPAFSRDGARIAYTVTGPEWQWDTWVVPLVGGEPRVLLPNASALQWVDDRRVIFAEFKKGMQLGIVLADESRAGARDLYVPDADAMAHHAEIAPDGGRVAIGEMRAAVSNTTSIPLDCFITRVDNSSGGHVAIGNGDVACAMFLRWSHDGRWIYFSSGRGNQYQVFRQPAGGGRPEQITSGTGLAVLGVTSSFVLTPDDRTLIYPSGEGQEAISLRRIDGTATQLTVEGNARDPVPSRDGRFIFYIAGPRFAEGQLWMRSLDGSTSQQICPGFTATSVAPSPDGTRVVFTTRDAHTHSHLWVGSVNNASPPRELAGGDADWLRPVFGTAEQIVFAVERRSDGGSRVVAVPTGTGEPHGLTAWEPGLELSSVSPDGHWISVVRASVTPREAWLYPTDSQGTARKLWNTWALAWTADARGFLLTSGGMVSRAWMLRNPDGALLPPGLGGDPSETLLEGLGGRRVMTEYFFVEPTPLPDGAGIVYSKVENHSNLYQLTLPE